eukprot:TRINITY_DN1703_c0_g1_i1.p1 TRINITY_DN1703_c0_g1~~TRINITY_DN1703_c0_g1_i1.p1  ORF type:complete len:482 (-),score=165.16 TRINITY_DN1703_c0_g1_i1:588-2033(-)
MKLDNNLPLGSSSTLSSSITITKDNCLLSCEVDNSASRPDIEERNPSTTVTTTNVYAPTAPISKDKSSVLSYKVDNSAPKADFELTDSTNTVTPTEFSTTVRISRQNSISRTFKPKPMKDGVLNMIIDDDVPEGEGNMVERADSHSVVEPERHTSNNVMESHDFKAESDRISVMTTSSSNTEDFGSDFEKWNNELMTINEISDEDERIDAQYKLLESIIYPSPNDLTKSGIRALVERCSQESLHRCDKCGYTPLHNAAKYGEVDSIRALLDGVDFDYRNVANNWFGDTPLHDAASSGKVDSIRALLDGADPDYCNMTNKDGDTPLHIAALNGKVDSIRALLDGADPDYCNMTNKDGDTPLHIAALNGKVDSIRALLDGADPDYRNVTNKNGYTPLHVAAYNGNVDSIHALLDSADPDYRNATDKHGETPLHTAARYGKVESIRVLLDGADPDYHNVTNKVGRTGLYIAEKEGFDEVVELLK